MRSPQPIFSTHSLRASRARRTFRRMPAVPATHFYHTFAAGIACPQNSPTHARGARNPFFTTHSLRAWHARRTFRRMPAVPAAHFLPHIRCGHRMPAEHSDACPRCPQPIFTTHLLRASHARRTFRRMPTGRADSQVNCVEQGERLYGAARANAMAIRQET